MIFGERYDMIKILGKGATATVYLAQDRHLDRFVAIKAGENKELLRKEAAYQAKLHGIFFPALFDCIEVSGQCFLVMEYIEGENLLQRKERIQRYTEEEVFRIIIQVTEAMEKIHNANTPCVYGDLKPENIMVQRDGRIKIVDFGTLVPLDATEGCSIKKRGGTPKFAAPEQWRDKPDVRNDIYGLGMLMREMMLQAGELCCSKEMSRIIERCVQKQKEKRFSTMEQVRLLCEQKIENNLKGETGK